MPINLQNLYQYMFSYSNFHNSYQFCTIKKFSVREMFSIKSFSLCALGLSYAWVKPTLPCRCWSSDTGVVLCLYYSPYCGCTGQPALACHYRRSTISDWVWAKVNLNKIKLLICTVYLKWFNLVIIINYYVDI